MVKREEEVFSCFLETMTNLLKKVEAPFPEDYGLMTILLFMG